MGLGWLDLSVIGLYFAVILGVGLWAGRREKNTTDFFLGGRKQHWLLAGMSIIAAEVSALTLIGVPGEAFRSDWTYLQMYAGSFLGRVLIVFLLLPAFYGGAVTTVYEFLGQRFGPYTRVTASIMFLASRVVGSGIRLLVASLAISEVFGWSLPWVIIATAGITTIYATYGGIKAILWTDALQACIYIASAVIVVGMLLAGTPGSWEANLSSAYEAGKLHTFTWDANPNNDKAFWVLMIHATVLNMAAMGTDQDMTQRMLTCPNLRDGQRSLTFNAFAGFPIVVLFLLIGSLLFVFYQAQPMGTLPDYVHEDTYRVFPFYIAHGLPHNVGLKGLLVSAVFAASMGSLSSAIGALSSTTVTDLYRPIARVGASEAHFLLAARVFTALFGVLLVTVAIGFAGYKDLLWQVFKWVSLVFGGMLGVFLLGVTTRHRGRDLVNPIAMVSSTAILVAIMLYQDWSGTTWIAWPWWVVVGMVWTYAIAACWGGQRNRGTSSNPA